MEMFYFGYLRSLINSLITNNNNESSDTEGNCTNCTNVRNHTTQELMSRPMQDCASVLI